MSSAVAAIGLTVGGVDVQVLDGIFLEIVRGLNEPPSVRGSDTIVPGRAGRITRNRQDDVWTIELRGYVAGNTQSAFRTNAKSIRALFDPKVLRTVVATLEDGTTATITARTLNTVWDQGMPEWANVSIEMEAVEDWLIV